MRNKLAFAFLALALGLFSVSGAQAADIKFFPTDKGNVIVVSGEIVSGDEEKFSKIALQANSGLVVLSSPGGALIPALEIGKIIQIRGFATFVPANTRCVSACALLWVAGEKRLLASSAQVGFHASYRDNKGRLEEAGTANALVGRYLTLLNLSERAIIFATSASPYEVLWLSPQIAAEVGIPYSTMDLGGESRASADSSGAPLAPPPVTISPQNPSGSSTENSELASWYYAVEGNGTSYYVRGEDVMAGSASSREARMWVKTDDSQNKGVDYRSSMALYTVDCVARTSARTYMIFYDAEGTVLETNTSLHRQVIVPDTIMEDITDLVCSDEHPGEDSRDLAN